MKWVTHQSVGVLGAVALHMPPLAVAGVFIGSTLPDVLDFFLVRLGFQFNKIHRGHSHFWVWYALAAMLMALGYQAAANLASQQIILVENALFGAFGVLFGSLSHILTDFMTVSGVPYTLPVKKRVSLGLIRTGHVTEYLFLTIFVFVITFGCGEDILVYYRNMLTSFF